MPFSFIPHSGQSPGWLYVFSFSHFIGHWYCAYFFSLHETAVKTYMLTKPIKCNLNNLLILHWFDVLNVMPMGMKTRSYSQ